MAESEHVWQTLEDAIGAAPSVDISWISPPARDDGWPLATDAVRLLTTLVERMCPRHVVELGAGLSTRVLARACGALDPPAAITSIENDPEHAERVQSELLGDGMQHRVTALSAALVTRYCGGRLRPVYAIQGQRFGSELPADLVLIDGPPDALGGRGGTLYQVAGFARVGTLVLLDDAARDSEERILDEWRDDFEDAIEIRRLPGFTKGLAALLVRSESFVRRAVQV